MGLELGYVAASRSVVESVVGGPVTRSLASMQSGLPLGRDGTGVSVHFKICQRRACYHVHGWLRLPPSPWESSCWVTDLVTLSAQLRGIAIES